MVMGIGMEIGGVCEGWDARQRMGTRFKSLPTGLAAKPKLRLGEKLKALFCKKLKPKPKC
jgi:hypothetical protein